MCLSLYRHYEADRKTRQDSHKTRPSQGTILTRQDLSQDYHKTITRQDSLKTRQGHRKSRIENHNHKTRHQALSSQIIKTRQNKTLWKVRQDKTISRPDETRRGNTRQHDITKRDMTRKGKTKQDNTGKARQDKTKQGKA